MKDKEHKKEEIANITGRLKEVIDYFAKNKQRFAKELGYHPQKIYDITTEKVRPDVDLLRRICENPLTSQVNIRWLLTGKGKMMLVEEQTMVKAIELMRTLIHSESKKIASLMSST